MLKKLSVTAVVLAMSAMLLVLPAYAVQAVDPPGRKASKARKGGEVCSGKTVLKYRTAGCTTIRMASWMSISPVLCKSETLCTMCRQKAA